MKKIITIGLIFLLAGCSKTSNFTLELGSNIIDKNLSNMELIEQTKQDEKFMRYLDGEHQKIMTGTIFGVDWRIKIDNYIEN